MNSRTKRVLRWGLLPLAIFTVGVVNYLAGGPGTPEPDTALPARLDYTSPVLTRSYRSETVLELPWGDGETEAALSTDGDGEPISTVEAVVAEPGGAFLVVDHPTWHSGARVRRYSADGSLLETVLTPSGSTLFTSADGRLAYVIAKSADASERLVVRDGAGETTWTVPLSLNSGSVLSVRDDLWVTTTNSEFDTEAMVVTATDIAVPVVTGGRQVTDDEAAREATGIWMTVGDRSYGRVRIVEGNGPGAVVTQTITRLADGTLLQVPGRSMPLGIDADELVYVLTEPGVLSGQERYLPGTLQAGEHTDEMLVGTFDGTIIGRIVVPGSVPTVGGWTRMSVSEDGSVLAAISDVAGVRIVRYTAVDAND